MVSAGESGGAASEPDLVFPTTGPAPPLSPDCFSCAGAAGGTLVADSPAASLGESTVSGGDGARGADGSAPETAGKFNVAGIVDSIEEGPTKAGTVGEFNSNRCGLGQLGGLPLKIAKGNELLNGSGESLPPSTNVKTSEKMTMYDNIRPYLSLSEQI